MACVSENNEIKSNDPDALSSLSRANEERKPDPRGLGVVIFEKMKKHENAIVQIDVETGVKETHGEFRKRAIMVAQEMQARNFTSDDIISICSENNMDCYVPLIAAIYLGIKVAPLDPMLSVRECVYAMKLVEPKLIFCGVESVALIEESIKKSGLIIDIVVFGDTNDYIPFAEFLISTGKEENFVPKIPNDIRDTALILFTSGTTGLPKGVCVTYFGLMHEAMHYKDPLINLSYSRLYWISGPMLLLAAIYGGGIRLVGKKFDQQTIFKHIYEYQANMLFLSPYHAYKITDNPEYNIYDTSCLKVVVSAGGLVSKAQILKLRQLFPDTPILTPYGMAETTTAGIRFDPFIDQHLINTKIPACGRKVTGIQYKVLDMETNEEVGPHQMGEIYIKTPTIMNGYYKNPEETAKVFDSDGYYKTGDILYFDEDGCFYVVDRIKNMMKYQSWTIAPGELEEILLLHPDVKDAVVISKPDEVDGDQPMGIVVLTENSTSTEETIIKFVADKVLYYKRLTGGVRIVSEIPMTPTGKYKRRELRQMILQNKV